MDNVVNIKELRMQQTLTTSKTTAGSSLKDHTCTYSVCLCHRTTSILVHLVCIKPGGVLDKFSIFPADES